MVRLRPPSPLAALGAGARGELERLGAATGGGALSGGARARRRASRRGGGGLAWAAAVAVALAREADGARSAGGDGAVLLIEVGRGARSGPDDARRRRRPGARARAARGRASRPRRGGGSAGLGSRRTRGGSSGWARRCGLCAGRARAAVVCDAAGADAARARGRTAGAAAVLLRAELPRQRPLAALAVGELRGAGLRTRIAPRAAGQGRRRGERLPGSIPAARPRGDRRGSRAGCAARSPARASHGLRRRGSRREAGQALPLVLGGVLVLVLCTLLLAALGGAVTGKSRVQRAADLAALSAARSMRDDFERLFAPGPVAGRGAEPRAPGQGELPRAGLGRGGRSRAPKRRRRGRLRVEFPDAGSFAPLRVRAEVDRRARHAGRPAAPAASDAEAEAEAVAAVGARRPGRRRRSPPAAATPARSPTARGRGCARTSPRPSTGSPRRRAPTGISLLVTRAYRSDAEQAALWAENPDPRWVAPPGTSLHRCATELDLGPPAAYGWLAANARRFGFLQRYCVGGVALRLRRRPGAVLGGGRGGSATADGRREPTAARAATSLPAFVPARFRAALAAAGAALERLRGVARRAADGGVELQPVRRLARRRRRDRPVHAGDRGARTASTTRSTRRPRSTPRRT